MSNEKREERGRDSDLEVRQHHFAEQQPLKTVSANVSTVKTGN